MEQFVRTLAFFPWLQLRSEYRFREFALLPYQRGKSPGSTPEEQGTIDRVLESYHAAHGQPVDRATILQHHLQSTPTAELSAAYQNDLSLFADLMAFAGLAARQFFNSLCYCNRDIYHLVVQNIPELAQGVLFTTRGRDRPRAMVFRDKLYIVRCPEHVIGGCTDADPRLMTALLEARAQNDWPQLYRALTLFNEANTDRSEVPIATEVILTYAALEQVLGMPGKNPKKIAKKLEKQLQPSASLEKTDGSAPEANQGAARLLSQSTSLRAAWLQDLANSRGSLAHGHALASYPSCWPPGDHLLFGAHIVPLLIKQRLESLGVYQPGLLRCRLAVRW